MPVLPPVCEGEPRGIGKARRRAVHHLRNQRERLQCSRTELFEQEERREIAQVALVCERQHGAQALLIHVHGAHVMSSRHLETFDLADCRVRIASGDREQRVLRRARPAIHEIGDGADVWTDDGSMRLCGELADLRRVPVIAPRGPRRFVHALLDDRPFALGGEHERVQVDLKAVRDGVVVDACGEPARSHQRFAVKADAFGDASKFRWGVA